MMKRERLPRAPIDMCNGPIISQLLRFAVPMMLTSVLQILYNTVDLVVIGQFAGKIATAAISATASLTSLLINLFIGLSVGANVVIAQALGADDREKASNTAHTALVMSVVSGVLVGGLTFLFAPQLLTMMGVPAHVLPSAILYLRILACGFPMSLLYNFAAAILRACGNTKHPLYFLLVAGGIKVLLNLLLVGVFRLDAGGVATATVISQFLSATLAVYSLKHFHGPCRLFFNQLRIRLKDFIDIVKIGVPAGIQSICFNLANTFIQSSINTCGAEAIAGHAQGYNLECLVFACVDAVSQANLTFVGQNMGAKNYKRIPRIIGSAVLIGIVITVVLSTVLLVFPQQFLSIFTNDAGIIRYGELYVRFVMTGYFLVPLLYTFSYSLRAIGYSALPMFLSVLGICGVRLTVVYLVQDLEPIQKLQGLYLSFPVSWIITLLAVFIAFLIAYQRLLKRAAVTAQQKEETTV